MKGTEKQVAWAKDIREQFNQNTLGADNLGGTEEIRAKNLADMKEMAPKSAEMFLRIMSVDDAKWWIENRDYLKNFTPRKLLKMEARGQFSMPA
jgi:hypothetical protein